MLSLKKVLCISRILFVFCDSSFVFVVVVVVVVMIRLLLFFKFILLFHSEWELEQVARVGSLQ